MLDKLDLAAEMVDILSDSEKNLKAVMSESGGASAIKYW